MTDPSKDIPFDMFGDVFGETMMPGQEPYTPEERVKRDHLIADAAAGDPGEAGEAEVLEKYRVEHEAMVLTAEQAAKPPRARNVTPAPYPVAIIYPSRSGNPTPHIVTLALFHCTCEAGLLGNRDCWAITEAKRLFGEGR